MGIMSNLADHGKLASVLTSGPIEAAAFGFHSHSSVRYALDASLIDKVSALKKNKLVNQFSLFVTENYTKTVTEYPSNKY